MSIPTDRKHLLLVAESLDPADGGGSAVAAWSLQALQRDFVVSVLTWKPVDLEATNRAFSTTLETNAFRWFTVWPLARSVVAALPFRLSRVQQRLLARAAARRSATDAVDLVLGLSNEIVVDAPAVQYIHYPWDQFSEDENGRRWFHSNLAMKLYQRLADAIATFDDARILANTTLVNSDWTGRIFEARYGGKAETVYPPVPGDFPDIPFGERQNRFAVIGRIAREKMTGNVIEIVRRVRELGHDVGLDVIGYPYHRDYLDELTLQTREMPWVAWHLAVPRSRLVEVVAQCRFGLHGMVREHFGIGPAELQRAGCITFVPCNGGQEEVVGGDSRVIYQSIEDAVIKIDRTLKSAPLQSDLVRAIRARRERLTEHRFMADMRRVVDRVLTRPESIDE